MSQYFRPNTTLILGRLVYRNIVGSHFSQSKYNFSLFKKITSKIIVVQDVGEKV